MSARLFCRTGDLAGSEFGIDEEATIGRTSDNSIVLDHGSVSRAHARIARDPETGTYVLEDLGSLNGTALDGVAVEDPEPLGALHVVTFAGELDFIFQADAPPAAAGADEAAAEPPAEGGTVPGAELPGVPGALLDANEPAAERPRSTNGGTVVDGDAVSIPEALADGGEAPLPARSVYYLEIAHGRVPPVRHPLRQGANHVGRSAEADISVDSRQLSRRHAVLTVDGERLWLRDRGSRNHTFVDDRRLDAEVEITADSRLRFGTVEARIGRLDQG